MTFFVLAAIGVVLYFAKQAFLPIALALLLALVLSGPVESLKRLGVPRVVSALAIVFALFGLMVASVNLLWSPAQEWFADAPRTAAVIKRKISPVARFMDRVEQLTASAGQFGTPHRTPTPRAAGAAGQPASRSAPGSTSTPGVAVPAPAASPMSSVDAERSLAVLRATRAAFVSLITVVIVTLFLVSGGPPMLARMTAAIEGSVQQHHVIDVIEKVRAEVGRFYRTTAAINLGVAIATWGAMTVCGMPSPLLWGTVAGLLNFIPYAGPATTLMLLTVVAIVSFDGYAPVIAVVTSYVVIAGIEGQLVQPLLVGRRLSLNPLLVFLALWFGGMFWGVAGIVLATPTLVAVKVAVENSPRAKSWVAFLSPPARAS
jgi:predicted PurR-regulated permease PerM